MKKKKKALYFPHAAIGLLMAAILFVLQSPASSIKFDNAILRICVLKDAPQLELSIKGYYKIVTLRTSEVIMEGRNLYSAAVSPTPSGLVVGGEPVKIYGIKIIPKKDASIYIADRSFRGTVDIIRTADMHLLVVNHVNVEDYLKGVLYHEVSHWWPLETLKAQAITARSYALYQKIINRDKDYDLTNDIYSQVYGGKISEKFKTNRAVDLTRGRVLMYNGELFPAYYHATCGGRTEDASNMWNINIRPLKSVNCTFCRRSPHYRWRYKIPLSTLKDKLTNAGYNTGAIKEIRLEGITSGGRVRDVKVIGEKTFLIPAKDFRIKIGPNLIRSANFRVRIKDGSAVFKGRGWGHGAGMCQWGAYFLGLKGYKAERILNYYYKGAAIDRVI